MNPFGYLFIAAGVLLLRQVVVGRVDHIPDDFRDMVNALTSGNMDSVSEISSRRGTNVSPSDIEVADSLGETPDTPITDATLGGGGKFAKTVVRLGSRASGYRLGATGPDYFDCSGLIWRACKNVGAYDGVRFTTSTFRQAAQSRGFAMEKKMPSGFSADMAVGDAGYGFEDFCIPGDILLWPTRHMGIYLRGTIMYSARSTAKGIGESDINGDSTYFGRWPEVWQLTDRDLL